MKLLFIICLKATTTRGLDNTKPVLVTVLRSHRHYSMQNHLLAAVAVVVVEPPPLLCMSVLQMVVVVIISWPMGQQPY